MAAPKVLEIVANDVLTVHALTIYEDDGTKFNLTDATEIKIQVAAVGGAALILDTTCAKQSPNTDGICWYTKQVGELNTVGLFHAALQVTESGGRIITTKRFDIRVVKDLP